MCLCFSQYTQFEVKHRPEWFFIPRQLILKCTVVLYLLQFLVKQISMYRINILLQTRRLIVRSQNILLYLEVVHLHKSLLLLRSLFFIVHVHIYFGKTCPEKAENPTRVLQTEAKNTKINMSVCKYTQVPVTVLRLTELIHSFILLKWSILNEVFLFFWSADWDYI